MVWKSPGRSVILGAVVATGLGFRLWGINWGLYNATVDQRPHPDEWVLYWLFRWFDEHHNLNPCPSFSHGQCFFDWGAVYPYLAYLAHAITLPFLSLVSPGPH